ncbi:MAG: PEP-CTERM sorting domain-containing protein [Verrucomicrobiota bacterium]
MFVGDEVVEVEHVVNPEPSTVLLGAIGLLLIVRRRR